MKSRAEGLEGMSEFQECFAAQLANVLPNLRGADVFVDSVWADVFHWNVAPSRLLGAQPECVHELRPDSAETPTTLPYKRPAAGSARRAVFFVGSFLHTYCQACCSVLQVRKDAAQPYRECVVYSALSNLGHATCQESVQSQYGTKGAYLWFKGVLESAIGTLEDGTRPFASENPTSNNAGAPKAKTCGMTKQHCKRRVPGRVLRHVCQGRCGAAVATLPAVLPLSGREPAQRVCPTTKQSAVRAVF